MAILTLLFGREVLGTYEMDRDVFVLGRATDCDIVVDNLNVSRHHCKIEKRDGLYYIEDLKSNNGTFLNGNRITSETLTFGDEIGIGKHTLLFESHARASRRPDDSSAPPQHQVAMEMDESGTVFVKPEQMAAIQQKMTAARRAHLRIAGVPGNHGTVDLGAGQIRIGRDPKNDVCVPGLFIGGTHCVIGHRPNGYYIEHVSGLRPLRINGRKVRTRSLADGDVIQVGGAHMTFYDSRDN